MATRSLRFLGSVFLAIAAGATVTAQVAWTRITPSSSPPARVRAGFVYDAVRERFVLFGGMWDPSVYTVDDTWSYDGSNWAELSSATRPPARQWPSMVYDARRDRVVLFGGMQWVNGTWPWLLHGDTWEFDGVSWVQRTPANRPPPRSGAGMAYDEHRGVVVLFGGYSWDAQLNIRNHDDTWEWDGDDWTEVTPPTRPSPRDQPLLAYDPVRRKVLMTGGVFDLGTGNSRFLDETWHWDGVDWTRLSPAVDPISWLGEVAALDPVRGRIVRYQGVVSGKVFEWDGSDWIERTASPRPTDRMDPMLAFDRRRGAMVMFGGHRAAPPFPKLSDTWEYGPVHAARFDAIGAGCAASSGVPALGVESLPWLGETMAGEIGNLPGGSVATLWVGASATAFGPFALPLDLGFAGAVGCHLRVALHVPVPVSAGAWSVAVPAAPTLAGLPFFVQGAVFDPAANALGVAFSDAGTARIGSM